MGDGLCVDGYPGRHDRSSSVVNPPGTPPYTPDQCALLCNQRQDCSGFSEVWTAQMRLTIARPLLLPEPEFELRSMMLGTPSLDRAAETCTLPAATPADDP